MMLGLHGRSLVFTAGLRALKAACDAGTVAPSVGLPAGSQKNRCGTAADVCERQTDNFGVHCLTKSLKNTPEFPGDVFVLPCDFEQLVLPRGAVEGRCRVPPWGAHTPLPPRTGHTYPGGTALTAVLWRRVAFLSICV